MAADDLRSAVEILLRESSAGCHELGGLEFYGYSREFLDLVRLCRDFASSADKETPFPRHVYVFLAASHGKSSFAKASAQEATANGIAAFYLDGTRGATGKELLDLRGRRDALVIVDGLPEAGAPRKTLLGHFSSLKGRAMLFARPEYGTDAGIDSDAPKVRIAHVDERPLDKIAWFLGVARAQLRDASGRIPTVFSEALKHIPLDPLVTLCGVPLGPRVADMDLLTSRVAQAIRLGVGVAGNRSLSTEELSAIFVEFHTSGSSNSECGFRLWAEGESDMRILRLVCRLAFESHGVDLEEGLSIVPLGEGREGGTSRATEVVVANGTRRNKDIFLFDCDEPGRHARGELEVLDQEVVLLDSRIACSRTSSDVEIEDFVSLGCLDRFYATYPNLRPEMEIIRYKPPVSRRLVIEGSDKEKLIEWLEFNARLEDVENLLWVLCEIRRRFSLRNLPAMEDTRRWRARLIGESDSYKQFGNRSEDWLSVWLDQG